MSNQVTSVGNRAIQFISPLSLLSHKKELDEICSLPAVPFRSEYFASLCQMEGFNCLVVGLQCVHTCKVVLYGSQGYDNTLNLNV